MDALCLNIWDVNIFRPRVTFPKSVSSRACQPRGYNSFKSRFWAHAYVTSSDPLAAGAWNFVVHASRATSPSYPRNNFCGLSRRPVFSFRRVRARWAHKNAGIKTRMFDYESCAELLRGNARIFARDRARADYCIRRAFPSPTSAGNSVTPQLLQPAVRMYNFSRARRRKFSFPLCMCIWNYSLANSILGIHEHSCSSERRSERTNDCWTRRIIFAIYS